MMGAEQRVGGPGVGTPFGEGVGVPLARVSDSSLCWAVLGASGVPFLPGGALPQAQRARIRAPFHLARILPLHLFPYAVSRNI